MAASEKDLGALHNKIAKVMGNALDQIDLNQQAYELSVTKAIESEDPDSVPLAAPELNPALLSVIERFLVNNKITCVPEEGNEMGELEQKLAAKRDRRARRQVGNVVHLEEDDD